MYVYSKRIWVGGVCKQSKNISRPILLDWQAAFAWHISASNGNRRESTSFSACPSLPAPFGAEFSANNSHERVFGVLFLWFAAERVAIAASSQASFDGFPLVNSFSSSVVVISIVGPSLGRDLTRFALIALNYEPPNDLCCCFDDLELCIFKRISSGPPADTRAIDVKLKFDKVFACRLSRQKLCFMPRPLFQTSNGSQIGRYQFLKLIS